jgi:hypothetical protein
MKFLILTLIAFTMLISCFSAKGLPIKEAQVDSKEIGKDEKATEENSTNEKISVEAPVEDVTMEKPLVDHSAWDDLLKKYVADNGDVNYKGFKKDIKLLNEYTTYLAKQVPSKNWSLDEQLAYFINVYNANTIKLIADNYPLKSIKNISNPWLKNRLKIGDKEYSLADIENGILRKMNEPKIHFAINCASYSCPKLLNTAYTAQNVQELMELATREFINNASKNELGKDEVKISEIFKWYKGDFTEGQTIIEYINQYSDVKLFPNAKINYIDYDWSLNEQK